VFSSVPPRIGTRQLAVRATTPEASDAFPLTSSSCLSNMITSSIIPWPNDFRPEGQADQGHARQTPPSTVRFTSRTLGRRATPGLSSQPAHQLSASDQRASTITHDR
jgi:hypothetical protein